MHRRIALAAALAVVLGATTFGILTVGLPTDTSAPTPRTHVERLDLDLPVTPPSAELTGTDAGLVTTPATIDGAGVAGAPSVAPRATRSTSAPVAPPPVVEAPAVAPAPVVEPAPEPQCAAGEQYDGERCVAQQLPEEAIGGARCPDPAHVVVAIRADGSLVCGPADDTAEAQQ